MSRQAERVVRAWRAVEMFSPRALPVPDVRENVIDVTAGNPLPWQPGGRLAGRPAGPGKVWRHQVFGGLFSLSRVRALVTEIYGEAGPASGPPDGQSALFFCTVSESGALIAGPAVSECAWAAGQAAVGHEAVGAGDPASWLTASSRDGCLRVSPDNLPAFPDGPPTAATLTRFTADLAELLGVTALLEPDGLRVRSYQVAADAEIPGAGTARAAPLSSYFAADLAWVAEALTRSDAGPVLTAFLREPEETGRIDVLGAPLTVRDGCTPDRMPVARWPAATPVTLSEQFAVSEILSPRTAPLSAIHAPPGSNVAAVFSDLIAAIITERARVLADLPSPATAFGDPLRWGSRTVTPVIPALTGFEILLATQDGEVPGLAPVGGTWDDPDYFASTARLAGGAEGWAMVRAHLDGSDTCRVFTDRFWHGSVHGSDALFRAGHSIREVLRDPADAGWPAAVARFRSALATSLALSAERSLVSADVTRLSALEQASEDAHESLEQAEKLMSELAEREPTARDELVAAEERRCAALADLEAHRGDRPGLVVAMSTGLRAGRDWYTAHEKVRATFDAAARSRDAALAEIQALRAELAAVRKVIASAEDSIGQLAAQMDALHVPVAHARVRWGDHMPQGPSETEDAETEDAALIDLREASAPWSDPEFVGARTELFLAALALHKSFVLANAAVFEANLEAWTEIACRAEPPPSSVALAAWQSFFLVVPIVSTAFASAGSLLSGLGRGSLGWLLAEGAAGVPPRHVAGVLCRAHHAVLAGELDGAPDGPPGVSALHLASRSARLGTSLPDGTWAGLPLHPRRSSDVTSATPSATSGETEALHAVLSDLRKRARSRRPTRTA